MQTVNRKARKAEHYETVMALWAAGLTQYDIADRLGLLRSTVRNWTGKPYTPLPPPPKRERRCDCGQPATRFDVPLKVGTGDGYVTHELYDLCEDCWQLEHEPIQTRREEVWNR